MDGWSGIGYQIIKMSSDPSKDIEHSEIPVYPTLFIAYKSQNWPDPLGSQFNVYEYMTV